MATLAFITGPDIAETPDRIIAGLSLTQRLVRQAVKIGAVDHIWVDEKTVARNAIGVLAEEATPHTQITVSENPADIALANTDKCVLVDGRTLLDDRIWNDLTHSAGPNGKDRSNERKSKTSDNCGHVPVVVSGSALKESIEERNNNGEAITALLNSHWKSDFEHISTYMENRRRAIPLLCDRINSDDDARAGLHKLINVAQKGVLDWPAWYIHRPIENWLSVHASRFPIAPNQITLLTGVMGFWATFLFARGTFDLALALALLVGILDGVDGKLARLKLLSSKAGEFEHLLDKIVEYAWYGGIAYFLSTSTVSTAPYIMGTALILFLIADEVQCEFFRRMSGRQICDAAAFDRVFRLVGGRRNTHMWAFIPFVLLDLIYEGFAVICVYGILTFFVHQARFIINSKRFLEASSAVLRETFRKTKVI